MVEYLRKMAARVAPGSMLVLAASLTAAPSGAQMLQDPTRPPSVLAPAGDVAGEPGPAAAPVLQSVIVSQSRKMAIINGKTVGLGEKYGDARVVKITESEVVLRDGTGTQTLKLFPSIEKKSAASAAGVNPGSGRK
jgi:MSHA biogenesis protein MshK